MDQPQLTTLNGFKTTPEILSLAVSEENVAPFSLPQEVLTYEPGDLVVVHSFQNGDKERKIHCNRVLDDKELQGLRVVQSLARDTLFFPSITSMATRYISRARGDERKAFKLMEETQKWRSTFFKDGPLTDKQVFEDMQHGIMYFTGRDLELRPTIVIRACRIPPKWYKEKKIDSVLRLLIFCMEYMLRYMVYPGRVENNNVIVDLKGLGITQVPISALHSIYSVMSHHYMGRVYRFYICNMSMGLRTLSGAVTALLTDRQRQKLVTVHNVSELTKDFAAHHLEQDLGGTRPIIKERFFPFPLQPGPFKPGTTAPDKSAVPNVHELLTPFGAVGKLLDDQLPDNGKSLKQFTPKARSIYSQIGLPVPKALEDEIEEGENDNTMTAPEPVTTEPERSLQPVSGVQQASSGPPAEPERSVPYSKEDEKAPADPSAPAAVQNGADHGRQQAPEDSQKLSALEEDVIVQPGGMFSCFSCLGKSCHS